MKEKDFIGKNKEKWQKLEEIVFFDKKANSKNLADYFTQTTEDLAYARTFYPNRSVRLYLNALSQKIYNKIYRNKAIKFAEVVTFFKYILPATMYEYRKTFFLCIALFVVSLSIGVISSANDADFAKEILGTDYVTMTEENIKNNDPMAVYKQGSSMISFLRITENNVRVSLLTFVSGLFAGIGSLGIMIQNGIMVGVFQYFFYERGLLIDSFLTIWMHGAFEICSIIIAATAGMVLGSGFIFPGTYSRFLSFRYSALAGLRIIVGVLPFILVAGFIEGFLTRFTDIFPIIRFFFILVCFGFMAFYFIIYPQMLASKNLVNQYLPKIVPYQPNPIQSKFWGIFTHSEIFSESSKFIVQNFSTIFKVSIFSGIGLFVVNQFVVTKDYLVYFQEQNIFSKLYNLYEMDSNKLFQFIIYALVYTCLHFSIVLLVYKKITFHITTLISFLIVFTINYIYLFINLFGNVLLGIMFYPFVLMFQFIFSDAEIPYSQKLGFIIHILFKSVDQTLVKLPSIIPVVVGAFILMSTPIVGFYLGMLYMNFNNPEKGTILYYILEKLPDCINFISFSFTIIYANIFVKFIYNNCKEIYTGSILMSYINSTPVRK